MKKLKTAAVAGSVAVLVSIAGNAADNYDSYVHLKVTDTTSKSSFFDNTLGHWQKKNAEGEFQIEAEGPHPGDKYYVPKDMILTTSNVTATAGNPIEYVFAGDELAVAERFQLILKRSSPAADDATVRIDNLVLLPGGHIYNANEKAASVSGACTVLGTSGNPSYWYNWTKNGRPILKSSLIGSPSSVFLFKNRDQVSEGKRTIFNYSGDASAFYGTMRLIGSCSQLTASTPGGLFLPGGVEIQDGAIFDVLAGSTATIGNLKSNGGVISLGVDNANSQYAKLVVTNSIATNGKPIPIIYSRNFKTDAETCELLKLSPNAGYTLAVDDFVVSNCSVSVERLANYPEAFLPNISLAVAEDEDGSRTLCASHRKIVYVDKLDLNEEDSLFLAENKTHWSDDSEISPENDYYIGVGDKGSYVPGGETVFGGRSLTLCDTGLLYFRDGADFTVPDFRWVACPGEPSQIQSWNGSSTVRGKVTLPHVDGGIFNVHMWNGGKRRYLFTIASELYGDGVLALKSNSTALGDPRAYYAITGLNTNFAGKIYVFHEAFGGSNKDAYEADPDMYCVTLSVSDSRNLGGSMASFAPDALLLSSHSLLETSGSLTFDESTRGWSIKGVGRIRVESGETLTITNKQITYSGEFRKEGAGVLKLGGTAKFTDGAADIPLAGTNILSIAEGDLMPADAMAFDGLEVRFAAGTKLLLDVEAEGDLAKYGMYNVKWNTPFKVDGNAALPVGFVHPDGFDAETSCRIAVMTVSPEVAERLDAEDFAVNKPNGMKAVISKMENTDEEGNVVSVTFVCDLIPCGFVITFR